MLIRFLKKALADRPRCDCQASMARGKRAFDDMEFRTAVERLQPVARHCGLDAEGLYMLGAALVQDGKLTEGEAALREALQQRPDHLQATKMLAMRYLLDGNWSVGFELYESMRHAAMRRTPLSEPDTNRDWLRIVDHVLDGIPPWRGERLSGKRILIWSEHGRGDAIMTLRLLRSLRERHGAAEVAGMSDLAEQCLFAAAGIPIFHELRSDWKPMPGQYDFHCSIFSLLFLLGVTPDDIPGAVPYLDIAESRRVAWKDRLAHLQGLRVGLAWGGNPAVPFDKLRSVPLATLAPLLDIPGVSFVSLQKDGPGREQLRTVASPPLDMMDLCGDLMDTAALIANLDLVVSVDSAVAHLAGAIGQRVWLLNRYESEWRWLRNREDSVWYPGMRIFSQAEPRNWDGVVERMAKELSAAAAGLYHGGSEEKGRLHVRGE